MKRNRFYIMSMLYGIAYFTVIRIWVFLKVAVLRLFYFKGLNQSKNSPSSKSSG